MVYLALMILGIVLQCLVCQGSNGSVMESTEGLENEGNSATESLPLQSTANYLQEEYGTGSYHPENTTELDLDSATTDLQLTTSELDDKGSKLPGWFYPRAFVIQNIYLWWNVIVSPIGILGNVMCIVVVSQKHNRGVSCSIYMGALAVDDTLMLIANLGQILLLYPLKYIPHQLFASLCKSVYYVMHTAVYSGVMIILALLAERVIAVTKPLQAATLLSPKKAIYIILGICSFCLAYNVPRIFIVGASVVDWSKGVGAHCTMGDSEMAGRYHMASFILMGVIPVCAIFIMNAIILYGVKVAKKRIARHCTYESGTEATEASGESGTEGNPEEFATITEYSETPAADTNIRRVSSGKEIMATESIGKEPNGKESNEKESNGKPIAKESNGKESNEKDSIATISKAKSPPHSSVSAKRARERRERQLTLMTIVMTTVFLVCSVPRYAHFMVYAEISNTASPGSYLGYYWSASTTSNLMVLNSAINFYLYVMTGARFRADVIKLLRCGA